MCKEIQKRDDTLKKFKSEQSDLLSGHAYEVEQFQRKIDSITTENTSKQSLKYEAEAMYARCQILEG